MCDLTSKRSDKRIGRYLFARVPRPFACSNVDLYRSSVYSLACPNQACAPSRSFLLIATRRSSLSLRAFVRRQLLLSFPCRCLRSGHKAGNVFVDAKTNECRECHVSTQKVHVGCEVLLHTTPLALSLLREPLSSGGCDIYRLSKRG
jgi:hypothetical protein